MLNNLFRTFSVVIITILSIAVIGQAASINVLIITGENNHKWKETTAALEKIYTDSGMFTVDVTTKPSSLDAPTLAKYEVLVNNWTSVGKTGHLWGEDTEKAIEEFVAEGKGFVAFHAGSSCFFDWIGFHKIVGGTWGKGTGHGKMHKFNVSMTDQGHPITQGLGDFETTDELWHKIAVLHPVDSRKVLCRALSSKESGGSGQMEDVAVCTQFGNGRGFYTTLGHDVNALTNPGASMLIIRATQWAATGKVTIDSLVNIDTLLRKVSQYKYGQSRKHLMAFENAIQQTTSDSASQAKNIAKIIDMLKTNVSVDCKKFLCWQLSLIATDNEVSFLANLLANDKLSIHARNALQRIATPRAKTALLNSLPSLKEANLAGTISSLGQLQSAEAVKAIGAYVTSSDKMVTESAIDALGTIGNAQAEEILKKIESKLSGERKTMVYQARLKCADTLTAAAQTYQQLMTAEKPVSIRTAAFMALLNIPDQNIANTLDKALSSTDQALHRAATVCLQRDIDYNSVNRIAKKLTDYSPAVQINVINTFATSNNQSTLPEIKKLVNSQNNGVKMAVLSAIGRLGNKTDISYLIARIPGSDNQKKLVIKNSLISIHGDGVDEALIAALSSSDETIRKELIAVIGARGITKASGSLLQIVREDVQNRQNAIKTLGNLADKAILSKLVKLFDNIESYSHRKSLERAMLEIISRENCAEPATQLFCSRFKRASRNSKLSLLRVLGNLGSPNALKTIIIAVNSPEKEVRLDAIRAMAAWKDTTAMMPLLDVVEKTDDSLARILGLRGIARLVTLTDEMPTKNVAAAVKKILSASKDPNVIKEAKALLGLLEKPINLALNAAASSPDGLEKDGDADGDQAGIDGDTNTYWDEENDKALYRYKVTIKKTVTISLIKITGYAHHNFAPKDFDIILDGKTVKTVKNAQYDNNVMTVSFPKTQAKSLELKITGRYGPSPAIRELEIFHINTNGN